MGRDVIAEVERVREIDAEATRLSRNVAVSPALRQVHLQEATALREELVGVARTLKRAEAGVYQEQLPRIILANRDLESIEHFRQRPPSPRLQAFLDQQLDEPRKHPGTVTVVDMFTGSRKVLAIEEIPEGQRFVTIDDPMAERPEDVRRVVPVVEVRQWTKLPNGALAPQEIATEATVHYLGPDGELLRSNTMVRAKPLAGEPASAESDHA